jgi:ornithine--oxo-acid transaminase
VVANKDVLGVFKPGQHGSTFGGNPLACAVAREVIAMLRTGEFQERSRTLGAYLHERLAKLVGDRVLEVRGRGLWAGVELNGKARTVTERLMEHGVLAKETHETTLRLAPPLVVSREDLDWALDRLEAVVG